MRYYLGLDNGGTTTKAALFDQSGNQIASAAVSTAMITPKPDFVERDMEEMWTANCEVIRRVIEESGVRADEIAGAAVCGHGKGLYLLDKAGIPARNGIISTDNRAYGYVERWKKDGTEEKAFEISCQHVMACQPVALLAWLKDNEPDVYGSIGYVFECKDYVRYRLTGEAKAEYTDYSGANLMNLHTREYDTELLRLFGIPEMADALPPLCRAAEIAGYVTEEAAAQCGLKAGTPVAGGMFDIDACALGTGVIDEDKGCVIAGTWSINEYLRRTPILDRSVKMNSLFALPEYYLIEESSPTSAGNCEWYIRNIVPELKGNYDELNRMVESIPPEEFVPVFLPFLMASNVHPNAKACFVGMTANHTPAHLLRSVYEGITFCHKMHMERLAAGREQPVECIRLAGGAAHSRVWVQMFADILETAVETVAAEETGALGCAIAVSVAVGDNDSLSTAADRMCTVTSRVTPIPEHAEIYRRKYELYKKTISCLDPLWDDMKKLM